MSDSRVRLRRQLQNVPIEAFNVWLGPHADQAGWDDSFATAESLPAPWNAYFMGKPLAFWQTTTWKLIEIHIGKLLLDSAARQRIEEIVNAWDYYELTGNWSQSLLANSPERITSILSYIEKEHKLPEFIVCFDRNGQWQLLDGYHRLAAAFIISPPISKPVRVWLSDNVV